MQGRHVTVQVRGFISRSIPWSLAQNITHAKHYTRVAIPGLLPYLDDYIMGDHDPFMEDFHWSMDDNRHTESKSPELTEGDVPNLLLFADRDVINRVRTLLAKNTLNKVATLFKETHFLKFKVASLKFKVATLKFKVALKI